MQWYSYHAAMVENIEEWLADNDIVLTSETDIDELTDTLWTVDGVTGNGGGGYTDDLEARDFILDNMDLAKEAMSEFMMKEDIVDYIFGDRWVDIDATIRCYLLNSVLWDMKKELNN